MKLNYQVLTTILVATLALSSGQIKAQGTTNTTSGTSAPSGKVVWTTSPFDYQVFIENKGQYDGKLQTHDKVLFAARTGQAFAYFTAKGVVYRYDEYEGKDGKPAKSLEKEEQNDKGDGDKFIKDVPHFLSATWKGSNSSVHLSTAEKQQAYYAFPVGSATVKTWAYKKITYSNIYPGIDAEYSFIPGKEGIKYILVVHPGANLSAVKLDYIGANDMKIDASGNLIVDCSWGKVTDHTPVSSYQENGNPVATSYQIINNNEETFSVNNRDNSKTLVIDPWSTVWTTNVLQANVNKGAYDVDYDYYGNVYVYGGVNPYQLVKLSSTGVVLWTFVTSNFTWPYYGDFAVLKSSGSVFACEGFGSNTGAQTDKINNAGVLASTFTATSSSDEDWRMEYDLCDHEIIIAGGGIYDAFQATILDTNLVGSSYVNVLNFPNNNFGYRYHDMYGIALDPEGGFCYMSPAHTASSSLDNNVIVKMPMPTLTPTLYNVPNGYAFQEFFSNQYVSGGTNGMNCMAANSAYLYMYDGITLKQFNAGTGAQLLSATLPGNTSFEWGGIDVDLCNNIYVGNQTSVQIYNGTLTNTGTMAGFPGTIYDVVLGNGVLGYGDSTLYVCGDGFVTRVALNITNPPKITKTITKVCSCNCTAKATLEICGAPDTIGVTYHWSNGQTTQTATNLCPGVVDTVTITVGCGENFTDTVLIANTGLLNVTKAQTDATCITPGTASVTVAGGFAPYTYLWTPGNQTTANISGLSAGNYCVSITDNHGCQDSVCFIISSPPMPTITVPADTACFGLQALLASNTVGGNPPYVYLWSNAATTASITVSPAATTTYTATVTDANGCSGSTTVQVVINPLPVVSVTPQNDTVCTGHSLMLTAAGAVTYTWLPLTPQLSSQTGATPTVTPTITTTYTVTGTDVNGCQNTATVTVVLGEPPTIGVTATNMSICQGLSVSLIASATNVTSPFAWSPGPLNGPVVTVTPTITTTYTVSASSGCGLATASITINVNQLPVTAFTNDNPSGCLTPKMCVQFRDRSTSSSGNITQWIWAFGNGDTMMAQSPIYCYSKPGSYNVTLTTVTDSGCSSTLNKSNYITVYSNPVASFSMSPQPTNILEPTIQFTDKSTDAYGIAYWWWNFGVSGNDTLSNLQNPRYKYWDTGSYCATEVVMNVHGCVDTTTNCLIIEPIFTCYIPSAFTPNGDGKNEVFKAVGNDVKSFEMYIFDRWGEQLFHSTDINNGWNGSVGGKGTICQEDSYVYMITVYDNKNKKHAYIGQVSLIR